jgi:hypothetical protein
VSLLKLRAFLQVVKQLLRSKVEKSCRVKCKKLGRDGIITVFTHAPLESLDDLTQEYLGRVHVDRGGTLVARRVQPLEESVPFSKPLEINDICHPRDGVQPVHRREVVVRVRGCLREVIVVEHVEKLHEGRRSLVISVVAMGHGMQEKPPDLVQ